MRVHWRVVPKYPQYIHSRTAYLLNTLEEIFPFNLEPDSDWPKDCQFAIYLENAVVAGLLTRREHSFIRSDVGPHM